MTYFQWNIDVLEITYIFWTCKYKHPYSECPCAAFLIAILCNAYCGNLLGVNANLCLHNSQYSFLLYFNHCTRLKFKTHIYNWCNIYNDFMEFLAMQGLNIEKNCIFLSDLNILFLSRVIWSGRSLLSRWIFTNS